jgi:nickel/cobalt exporter
MLLESRGRRQDAAFDRQSKMKMSGFAPALTSSGTVNTIRATRAMSQNIVALCATAATLGFLHTLAGPDHYLPFVVMAKARGWTTRKTLALTALCGLGHVGSSILIGAIGIAFGLGVAKIEIFEGVRGGLAAWLFILFGLGYFLWGLRRGLKNRGHRHFHIHGGRGPGLARPHRFANEDCKARGNFCRTRPWFQATGEWRAEGSSLDADGSLHADPASATDPAHIHSDQKPANITPWILFTIFVFGPCEPLIPLLMYPAAEHSSGGVVLVAGVFSVVTIATMMILVSLPVIGLRRLPLKFLERYLHAVAGFTILLCGLGIVFLGL